MLDLDDYYCVFEWGSGGVLHLHCILWNFKSHHLDDWDLKQLKEKQCFSKRKQQLIVDFFNIHVSEWNLGKEADGSWKNLQQEPDNAPHPASISKSDLDELFGPPTSGNTDQSFGDFFENDETNMKRLNFIVRLLEKVQQHNMHKPYPFGPPLPNQKCSKQKPKTQKKIPGQSQNYCAKGYPKPLCKFNEEYILQEPFKTHLYKLYLGRNDRTINNYNALISLALLANMDLQPVLTFEGLLTYCTKYITKNDNPDMFRDFRDDTGKPTDADGSINRTEIPIQSNDISKLLSKCFNDQIKYSMVSAPELHHHLLNLPTYFASRSFSKVTIHSDLNRILSPEEINNVEDNETVLMKDDAISIYEKRSNYEIPNVSIQKGISNETIKSMSFFLFHRTFFVKEGKLCKKSKAPILLLKPYLSPKKKNNEHYCKYMSQTLMAYKPFENRNEFLSLSENDLEQVFDQFIKSEICPFFVREKYQKANTRKTKQRSIENEKLRSTDEIYEAEIESSSDSGSDDDFVPDINKPQEEQQKEANDDQDREKEGSHHVEQIGKFTEAYQEYGHMAPKGLEYVGYDFGYFDDDKDVREEIRILSDEQDKIFDPSKDTWKPLHPDIIDSAMNAKDTLQRRIGLKTVSQNLDPNDLDPTQTLFVDTILDWALQCIKCKKELKPFPPLKVKLLGVAGTGKSRTIKTLVQEFDRLMANSGLLEKDRGEIKIVSNSDYLKQECGKIIMCAPTGVAAFNIGCGAASIHRTFHIPVRGPFKDLTGEHQKQLELDLENVWLVIIDEISMVGCEMFAKVNERLILAKLDENRIIADAQHNESLRKPTFGGVGMVVCGDFGQLVPIMQHSLMDDIPLVMHDASKQKDRFTNKGKSLFKQFKICIILTKQHRQSGGTYSNLCLKFRDGSFTPEDHALLQSRHYEYIDKQEKEHLTTFGTRLVATNLQAGNFNAKALLNKAREKNNKIFRIEAQETGNNMSKAVTTSEKFSGLKSTIHLTI